MKSAKKSFAAELFGEFIEAVRGLTPAERTIFGHYADGRTASEILQIMCISNNTLKTHNRHIYAKLGVSSRGEMLLYVRLIRKAGIAEMIR